MASRESWASTARAATLPSKSLPRDVIEGAGLMTPLPRGYDDSRGWPNQAAALYGRGFPGQTPVDSWRGGTFGPDRLQTHAKGVFLGRA